MLKKDISKKTALIIAGVLVAFKLLLVSQQLLYIMPLAAPIDDDLYFRLANSLTAGDWLGQYDYLTLSKYPLFAIWLAFTHALRLPYLLANQLLWLLAAGLCVWAFAPVIKKNIYRLGLFLLMFYNPATTARYTLRVYRDSIFPCFCLIFFVSLAGFALRYEKKLKENIPWLIFAGLGLGSAWLTREDGFWLLPYGIAALAITGVYIFKKKGLENKVLRLFSLTLPFVITGFCVLTICCINYKYYDRFIISDFTSSEFKTAYGNMTRLSHKHWNPLVAVPKDVRQRMYKDCDSLDGFEYYLEESGIKNAYMNSQVGDYQSGAFYWALRRSAQELGLYKDAKTAEKFYLTLSSQLEALCQKDPKALGKRSSTTPPIRKEYVPMVLNEVGDSLVYVLTLKDLEPYEKENLSYYTEGLVEQWEEYLGTKSNYPAVENSAQPYYSPRQMLAYKVLQGILWLYRILVPVGLVLWLVGLIKTALNFKNITDKQALTAIISFGLILMAIFRLFIIAYMEVAAFNIGIYAMYLGAVYPILPLCGFLGAVLCFDKNRPLKRPERSIIYHKT